MAPAALSPELEALAAYLKSVGLADVPALEITRSKPKPRDAIVDFCKGYKLESRGLSPAQAGFALQVGKDGAKLGQDEVEFLLKKIEEGQLDRADKVSGE